jgi:DNA-directed RNA polymerase specialized sigma24 family protein
VIAFHIPRSAGACLPKAFIKSYLNLSTYRGQSFRSWLFRIARKTFYDDLHRGKHYPNISIDSNPTNQNEGSGFIFDP